MSLVAMAIDMILPALPFIAAEFKLADARQAQHIISGVFAGMIMGKLLFGPLSDAWGRKPAIYIGLVFFILGSVICYFSTEFSVLFLGRVLQGFGVASPRIVSLALIRDQFEGREMARIMSFIMMVFILVPAIAPALGQAILHVAQWRMILLLFMLVGLGCLVWFGIRQPETLPADQRRPVAIKPVIAAAREVVSQPASLGYTFAIGFVFAGFVGYLVSSQQIFDLIYGRGEQFAYYFGGLALVIGSASIANARYVIKHGMRKLSSHALIGIVFLSIIASLAELSTSEPVPFAFFIAYCLACFFCVGILFGNLNAMAMEPLGHVAGTGAAIVGAGSTIISVVLGSLIGQLIGEDALPVFLGFLIMSLLTLGAFRWVDIKLQPTEGNAA